MKDYKETAIFKQHTKRKTYKPILISKERRKELKSEYLSNLDIYIDLCNEFDLLNPENVRYNIVIGLKNKISERNKKIEDILNNSGERIKY